MLNMGWWATRRSALRLTRHATAQTLGREHVAPPRGTRRVRVRPRACSRIGPAPTRVRKVRVGLAEPRARARRAVRPLEEGTPHPRVKQRGAQKVQRASFTEAHMLRDELIIGGRPRELCGEKSEAFAQGRPELEVATLEDRMQRVPQRRDRQTILGVHDALIGDEITSCARGSKESREERCRRSRWRWRWRWRWRKRRRRSAHRARRGHTNCI